MQEFFIIIGWLLMGIIPLGTSAVAGVYFVSLRERDPIGGTFIAILAIIMWGYWIKFSPFVVMVNT